MSSTHDPMVIPLVEVEIVASDFERAELGQWYWHKGEEGKDKTLRCVVEVGSNYLTMEYPRDAKDWGSSVRVHRDEFAEKLTFEPNANPYIQQRIAYYQQAVSSNMAQIQALSQNLGLMSQVAHSTPGQEESKSLAILSGQSNVEDFKQALITAKKETLPELFKQNEALTRELTRWMIADSMPMKARLTPMKTSIKNIDDRLFNIQLYAGLLDTIVTVSSGDPAKYEEKLRVMQRRLYMDEECLMSYESGGMEFSDMKAFDQWIARPENRDRIMPFERCMVSMQVRRKTKDRDFRGSALSIFINMQKMQADKFTFLYVRNGEQVYRIITDIDFGELMFPERSVYDPSEPMMMLVSGDRIEKFMSRREFDSRVAESNELRAKYEQWKLDNPQAAWEAANPKQSWQWANPYRDNWFSVSGWAPFDDSSVYYDQGMAKIMGEIKEYNRVALLIQGLFDRTKTLMPHPTVQMWKPHSFASSVELVYDSSNVLTYGEAPDIEAYVKACNAYISQDSVVYGQEEAWTRREAEKENTRTRNNWRVQESHKHFYEHLRPYGDPGPGRVAKMASWNAKRKVAAFAWTRERQGARTFGELVKATISVPLDKLFNVSAYQQGDYKRFFADPRTRELYLEWAPLLLSAEEYVTGKLAAQEPVSE